ncbi:hypothetical protein, partial [uncultured Adlercreutzia sp.]|uniref:hypothetical protein n=1 Tax=uncultured Adlercreutzia sp. TaxID=875803 RepID=UPI0026F38B32
AAALVAGVAILPQKGYAVVSVLLGILGFAAPLNHGQQGQISPQLPLPSRKISAQILQTLLL